MDANGNNVESEERTKSPSPAPAIEGKDRGLRIRVDMKPDSPLLIVLFGWAGCRDRYLSKYSQVYSDRGISTIRFTVPIAKVRSFDSYRNMAAEFHEHVWKTHGVDQPVLFHVFSMNGCSMFTALWEYFGKLTDGEKLKDSTRGVIFDRYRMIVLGFFSTHRMMMWLRSHFDSGIYERSLAFFCLLSMKDLPHRQLYIFSKMDEICTHDSIEHFAGVQKELQKETTISKWEESGHCEHLRHDPKSYTDLCVEFLKNAEPTVAL